MADPTADERRAFFNDLFLGEAVKPPKQAKSSENLVSLAFNFTLFPNLLKLINNIWLFLVSTNIIMINLFS